MARALSRSSSVQVWPAFTDAMLAFVLVLVLMLVYQVGRQIDITGPSLTDVTADMGSVEAAVAGLDASAIALVPGTANQTITFGSEVLFESGSSDFRPAGQALVGQLAAAVAGLDLTTLRVVQVEGHTDAVPTGREPFYTNLDLSTERAANVVRSLTASGIDPAEVQLSATGYGEFAPVASNETEAGRSANRRIEVRLVYDQAAVPAAGRRPA